MALLERLWLQYFDRTLLPTRVCLPQYCFRCWNNACFDISYAAFGHQNLQGAFVRICILALGVLQILKMWSPCSVGSLILSDPRAAWECEFRFFQHLCGENARNTWYLNGSLGNHALTNSFLNILHFLIWAASRIPPGQVIRLRCCRGAGKARIMCILALARGIQWFEERLLRSLLWCCQLF